MIKQISRVGHGTSRLFIVAALTGLLAACGGGSGDDAVDADGDGIPDADDPFVDLDGDGLDDLTGLTEAEATAAAADADGDGIPNGEDTDADGDGIEDIDDPFVDLDGDGLDDTTGQTEAAQRPITILPHPTGMTTVRWLEPLNQRVLVACWPTHSFLLESKESFTVQDLAAPRNFPITPILQMVSTQGARPLSCKSSKLPDL